MMKKILSVMLAALMLLAMTIPAMGAEPIGETAAETIFPAAELQEPTETRPPMNEADETPAPAVTPAPAADQMQPTVTPPPEEDGNAGIGIEDMPDIGPWELPGIEVGTEDDPADEWGTGPTPAPVTYVSMVQNLTAASETGEARVTLRWEPGPEPYREFYEGPIIYADLIEFHIFRATEEYGDYTRIATTMDDWYVDENVTFGSRYYYMVCTQVKILDRYYYTDPVMGVDTVSATVLDAVGTVRMSKAISVDTNAARVYWQAVPDVTGYQVFRSTSPDDGYTWLKNVTGCEASNYSLTGGTAYYYRVRAYRDVDLGGEVLRCYGAFSQAARVQVLGRVNVNTARNYGTNASFLRWPRVEGATAYQLFRKEEGVGEYVWVKNCTTPQVVNYALTPGKTYWYVIRAIVDQPEGRAYGAFSEGVSVTIPPIPQITGRFIVRPGDAAAELSWTRIYNMSGFQVYMSVGTPDNYRWMSNVARCDTVINHLTKGVKYWFKVRPFIEYYDGERAYGAFSSPFVGTP